MDRHQRDPAGTAFADAFVSEQGGFSMKRRDVLKSTTAWAAAGMVPALERSDLTRAAAGP